MAKSSSDVIFKDSIILSKVNLKNWIKNTFDFETADALKRAEAKGSNILPKRIAKARDDAYYAFTGEELTPTVGKKLKQLFRIEEPYESKYLTGGRPVKWMKGFGLEL